MLYLLFSLFFRLISFPSSCTTLNESEKNEIFKIKQMFFLERNQNVLFFRYQYKKVFTTTKNKGDNADIHLSFRFEFIEFSLKDQLQNILL